MHYGFDTIFLTKEITMKKLILMAVAVSSLLMVSCGGDGCHVSDTKCSGGDVMVCQWVDINDWDDGEWEVSEKCEDGETCAYNEEYDAHWCE